jgi:hypothetical protein
MHVMDSFPPADTIFAKVAQTTIDDPRSQRRFLFLLNLFGITGCAEDNRRKMIALAERGINPFDIDTIPKGFGGVYPEMSVSILFDRMDGPIAQRAAKLVLATLAYRQALLENALEQETRGGTVIDNSRSHNFFGRVANIRRTGPLKWTKEVKHCRTSSHIVVAVDGAYYKLDVLDGSGATIAAGRILSGIQSIMRAAASEDARLKPYGATTTHITRASEAIFYAKALDPSIALIDEAIFLLAIDTRNLPADENAAGQDLHIRNHDNRDFRKSLQVVAMENGYCGATINFFAEIEGVSAARFASWVSSRARNMPPIISEGNSDAAVALEFATIDFDSLPLRKLKGKIARYSCRLPLIKKIDAIGRDELKALRVSPDAFFHAAAHLAYYETFNKLPSVHNYADMRGIKFGSIARYLSTTEQMVDFLRKQTRAALLDAFEAHGKAIAVIKSGDYPLHYAYFYVYAAGGFKPVLAMILFKAFVPDVFRKYVSPDIGASNIPALPGIYCVGRFGTFFKTARKNCLAGHYLIFPDHIKICFPASNESFLEAWQFDRALTNAIIKLKRILSAPAG